MSNERKPLVYDAGLNVGLNLPYYFRKGYRVVGIEPNPVLANGVEAEFATEIARGDLTVVRAGLGPQGAVAPFYVNQADSVLSTFTPPDPLDAPWHVIDVPVVRLSDVVRQHGPALFVKIDVEGQDLAVLQEMFQSGHVPPHLSVEAHSLDVACMLVVMGYTTFRLVNCRRIGRDMAVLAISLPDGTRVPFRFPKHAAGPFGDDLPAEWVGAEAMILMWLARQSFLGRGWYDIHARIRLVGESDGV